MAEKEKELRKMSRTELIEIIYALKTSEDDLNKKNETLEEQLNQHKIDIEEADLHEEKEKPQYNLFNSTLFFRSLYLALPHHQ